jgi:hypothetical protein
MACLSIPAGTAQADWGCFNCVVDYNDCSFPDGVCSNKCEQVGHNEEGDGIQCSEVQCWGGAGGTECALSGGSCTHTEVNGNQDPPGSGNWCPDGEVC